MYDYRKHKWMRTKNWLETQFCKLREDLSTPSTRERWLRNCCSYAVAMYMTRGSNLSTSHRAVLSFALIFANSDLTQLWWRTTGGMNGMRFRRFAKRGRSQRRTSMGQSRQRKGQRLFGIFKKARFNCSRFSRKRRHMGSR